MFHSAHIQVPNRQRRRTGLTTFFPSSNFSPPSSRETMKKGIMFCSVAVILLSVGCILTWLEYNNMFGGKISMTGLLLIALAVLMMLLSIRQFRLARKRSNAANNSGALQLEAMNAGGVTALVIDHEDGIGTTAVILEAGDIEIEAESPRVHGEITPPSYRDATYLDCSSTCPSFISHDDHNEAPPTYEETCGIFVYGSETSLTGSTSPRWLTGESSSPKSPHHCNPNVTSASQRSMNTLSPSTALLVNPMPRPSLLTAKSESKDSTKNEISCCSNVSISSDETITLVSPPEHTTKSQNAKPTDWSRRSYSSIPSYTCLLSESGEVSSQVFSPTTIISQMNSDTETEQGTSQSSPLASASAPTRSHSASSINKLRQGVPYDLSITTSPKTAKAQKGTLYSISHTLDSPTRRRSEGSRPNMHCGAAQKYPLHPKSDSNISHLHSTQICSPSSIPLIHRSFDEGDNRRRLLEGNQPTEALSSSSLTHSHHSHELLTQDIQETI